MIFRCDDIGFFVILPIPNIFRRIREKPEDPVLWYGGSFAFL